MYGKYMKRTGLIFTLLVKQLRWKLFVWLFAITGINVLVASFYPSLYKDEASRLAASMTMENPAMIAMLGPGYETEAYLASPGPFFANEMLLFTAIAAAIMNILLVSQSTRGDEEAGRLEIVQARSVGKVAYTNAVMIIIFGANVLLSLLIGIGISLLQIEGMDWQSTMLFGSVLGLTGLVFGAMTLVIAQLVESARSVTMFSLMVLILSYLIRAIGDVNYEWLSYASPLGWTVRTKVFADDDWLPVIVLSVLTVFFGLLALYLHAKRDIGSGYFTPRKGRSHASKLLLTPFGFHLWMQKTNIAAWTLAIFVLSWSMGFVMGDMESYWQDIELIEQFLAADMQAEMTEQFITLIIAIMTLIGTIPVTMTVLHLKGEEMRGFMENMFSRATSRHRVLANYVLFSIFVSLLMQTALAVGFWSGCVAVLEEPMTFLTTLKAAFVYLPAMWLFSGIAVWLYGWFPKLTPLVWLYLSYGFFVMYLGNLLDMPLWLRNISVFEHVAKIPLEEVKVFPLAIIVIIAFLFFLFGFYHFRKRDLFG